MNKKYPLNAQLICEGSLKAGTNVLWLWRIR